MDHLRSDVASSLIALRIGRFCTGAAGNGTRNICDTGRGKPACARRAEPQVTVPAQRGGGAFIAPAGSLAAGPHRGGRAGTAEDRPGRRQEGGMRPRISVLLVDPMRLMRDCMTQLLQSGAADIDVHSVASLENATAGPEGPDIILINAMPKEAFLATVEQHVAQLWPGVPVLVIYDEDGTLPQGELIRNGTAGVFPASLGVTVLIATIRVILAHSSAGLGLPGTFRE